MHGTLGSLDEAFADRLQPGDRFLLDGKCLEYRARQEGAAVVEEMIVVSSSKVEGLRVAGAGAVIVDADSTVGTGLMSGPVAGTPRGVA